ncbi:hypothetical protein LCGC14_2563050, partial [marine sediment metagenome]
MNWETIKLIYYYVLVHNYKIEYLGKDEYALQSYYQNGQKIWRDEYKDGLWNGKCMRWFENGQINWTA